MMDTHYHLLLETPCGNLSQIMRHINGAYTTYFKEIGLHFGIRESGASQACRRVAQKTEKDKKLKKKIARLEKQINLSRMNGLLPKSNINYYPCLK